MKTKKMKRIIRQIVREELDGVPMMQGPRGPRGPKDKTAGIKIDALLYEMQALRDMVDAVREEAKYPPRPIGVALHDAAAGETVDVRVTGTGGITVRAKAPEDVAVGAPVLINPEDESLIGVGPV